MGHFSMLVKTVDYHDVNAGKTLASSLHDTGFAILVNHPVSPQRIDEAYAQWGAFFEDSKKHDWLRDPERQDGYFPFKSENAKDAPAKDLKEFFHVYPWGRVPSELETMTRQLYQDLFALGVELLEWLDADLPDHIRAKLS